MYKKGFIWGELLIVLGILLITAGGASFYVIRNKRIAQNDAQRKTDLLNIQEALESYFEDTNAYPETSNWKEKLTSGESPYLKQISQDPKTKKDYEYFTNGNPPTSYTLKAYLENKKDRGPNVSDGGYILTNKQ